MIVNVWSLISTLAFVGTVLLYVGGNRPKRLGKVVLTLLCVDVVTSATLLVIHSFVNPSFIVTQVMLDMLFTVPYIVVVVIALVSKKENL